jgi:hypothetical protein
MDERRTTSIHLFAPLIPLAPLFSQKISGPNKTNGQRGVVQNARRDPKSFLASCPHPVPRSPGKVKRDYNSFGTPYYTLMAEPTYRVKRKQKKSTGKAKKETTQRWRIKAHIDHSIGA